MGARTGAGGGFFATMVQDARAANDETLLSEDDDRVFYKLPVWQRIVIMLGGPVMNLLFAHHKTPAMATIPAPVRRNDSFR